MNILSCYDNRNGFDLENNNISMLKLKIIFWRKIKYQ